MKVLLCDDVDRLGWLGDVVEVATGYARNYLLPQGLAKVVTETNIKALAEEKKYVDLSHRTLAIKALDDGLVAASQASFYRVMREANLNRPRWTPIGSSNNSPN